MNKIVTFIAVLFFGLPAFAKDCYSGNNNCPSNQGCCSSRAEWIHTTTRDSGTCRELRHCDKWWIWNGGINPNSGLSLPGSIPVLPPGVALDAAIKDFEYVINWYDIEKNGSPTLKKTRNNPQRYLAVYPGTHETLDYTALAEARIAWIGCLIGSTGVGLTDNVAQYLNTRQVRQPQCKGEDNCVQWAVERAEYYRKTALLCLINKFYVPYTKNSKLPSVKYLDEPVSYSTCPAIYPNCNPYKADRN